MYSVNGFDILESFIRRFVLRLLGWLSMRNAFVESRLAWISRQETHHSVHHLRDCLQ